MLNLFSHGYFWNNAFKKLDFAFSGEGFTAKNKIKTLDIHFLPDFTQASSLWANYLIEGLSFCKDSYDYRDEGSEEGEREDFEDWDGHTNEPFIMKIIPQLTNLTSLKTRFSSYKTLLWGIFQ